MPGYLHKTILFIISEKLTNLLCRTHSSARNPILLLQAINPKSVLRQGNSLGPVPDDEKAGKLLSVCQLNVKGDQGLSFSASALW